MQTTLNNANAPWLRTKALNADFALFIWAILGALVIVLIRDARGFLDISPLQTAAEFPHFLYSFDTSISIYNKAEVRLLMKEFILWWVLLAVLLVMGRRYLSAKTSKSMRLHPVTALFGVLLFLASVYPPPYEVDLSHWGALVGPAVEIQSGRWPYLHTPSMYGFLTVAFLTLWTKVFSLTLLSAAALIQIFAMVSGWLAYFLTYKLTRSRLTAFLLSLFLITVCSSTPTAVLTPNQGPFRSHFMILAQLLTFWLSFSARPWIRLFASFCFGFTTLWNPMNGAFATLGFCLAHRSLSATLAMGLGILAILVPVLLFGSPDWTWSAIQQIHSINQLFLSGMGSFPQKVFTGDIFCIGFYILGAFLLYKRWLRSVSLRRRELFVAFSMFYSIPWVTYLLGRSDPVSVYPLYWTLGPAIALIVYSLYRAVSSKARVGFAMGLLACLLPVPEKLTDKISFFLTRYEGDRYLWSLKCADNLGKGVACDESTRVSLGKSLQAMNAPLLNLSEPENSLLINVCHQEIPIVSVVDSFVYLYGNCRAPFLNPPFVYLSFNSQIDAYIKSLHQKATVVLDRRNWGYPIYVRKLEEFRARLVQTGFDVTETCGNFVVLSNRSNPIRESVCKPPTTLASLKRREGP